MTDYSSGKIGPRLTGRTDMASSSLPSVWDARKGWSFIPLAPGLFGCFYAYNLYPLLDGRYLLIGIVFFFFLLTALAQRTAVLSGFALALLTVVLLLNGALDRNPPAEIKTPVIRKAVVTGSQKYGTHYDVIVSSWRPGKAEEEFTVDLGTFRQTAAGKTVTVELHKGYFGVPWTGNITPD